MILERGLRNDPTNIDLLKRMLTLMQTDAGPEADKRRASLRDLLSTAEPRQVPTQSWASTREHGRVEEARVHWEQALKLILGLCRRQQPRLAVSQRTNPDLTRA